MSSEKSLYSQLLIAGPHLNNRGGISAVLSAYKRNLPEFHMLATNSLRGTLPGLVNFVRTCIALPFARWFGGYRIIAVHASVGRSWKRKSRIVKIAHRLGYRIILHMHSGNFKNAVEKEGVDNIRKVLEKCDRVVFLTQGWLEYSQRTFALDNLMVINNMIDTPAVNSPAMPRSTDGKLTFVYLGWFIQAKGIFDLLESVAEQADYFRGKAMVVLGGRYHEEEVQAAISKLGIGDIIDYRGWIDSEDKDRLLRESHVLMLPSYAEGLPISLLEAMTYSMPVITTDVGGIPEIVRDGVNGIMHKPGDKEAIFRAMSHYIENPGDIQKHGDAGRKVSEAFTPEAIRGKIDEMLRSLL